MKTYLGTVVALLLLATAIPAGKYTFTFRSVSNDVIEMQQIFIQCSLSSLSTLDLSLLHDDKAL